MKRKNLYVVVIDDDSKSCRRIADRLTGLCQDEAIVISVSKVHVTVERGDVHPEAVRDKCEKANMGRSILAKFRDHSDVGYAVVLLTADDKGGPAGVCESALKPRARQNVVFELGFFLAKLGDSRVCCLCTDGVERPSELDGMLHTPPDEAGGWRFRLAHELKEAGFTVDLNRVA
jgi:hypothetical protein